MTAAKPAVFPRIRIGFDFPVGTYILNGSCHNCGERAQVLQEVGSQNPQKMQCPRCGCLTMEVHP